MNPDDGSTLPAQEAGVLAETGVADEGGWSADSGTLPDDASAEASSDAQVVADGGVVCSSRSGTFACQGQVCDRATQLCETNGGGCQAYDGVISQQQPEAGSCGACPTCACLQPTLWGSCTCQQDDAGSIAISCGGCYGAPPTRLERIA